MSCYVLHPNDCFNATSTIWINFHHAIFKNIRLYGYLSASPSFPVPLFYCGFACVHLLPHENEPMTLYCIHPSKEHSYSMCKFNVSTYAEQLTSQGSGLLNAQNSTKRRTKSRPHTKICNKNGHKCLCMFVTQGKSYHCLETSNVPNKLNKNLD